MEKITWMRLFFCVEQKTPQNSWIVFYTTSQVSSCTTSTARLLEDGDCEWSLFCALGWRPSKGYTWSWHIRWSMINCAALVVFNLHSTILTWPRGGVIMSSDFPLQCTRTKCHHAPWGCIQTLKRGAHCDAASTSKITILYQNVTKISGHNFCAS